MPTSETRIAARSESRVELCYQRSTLPTKENVEAYEAFCPGAAKIMLDMAQYDQHEHWQSIRRISTADLVVRLVGMTFCFLLCLALICGGVYLMATGHYVTGAASVAVALVAVIGSLAYGGRPPVQQTPSHEN